MIVGIVMGVISALLGLFSLKCFKMGSMEDSPRAKMTLTAGIMFIVAGGYNTILVVLRPLRTCVTLCATWSTDNQIYLSRLNRQNTDSQFYYSGICGIAGASIYANQIVASYMRTMYNPNYGGNEGIGGMGGGGFGGNSIPR